MKLKYFLILISLNSYSNEYLINSREESILAVKDEIIASNCSPSSRGIISELKSYDPAGKRHLLKFSPNGTKGNIVCSFITKENGTVSLNFILNPSIKSPIVDIETSFPKQSEGSLRDFGLFIQNKTNSFTKLGTGGTIKTDKYTYRFIEKFKVGNSYYFYKVKINPHSKEDGFEKLQMLSSQILYSHHKTIKEKEIKGISKNDSSYLYLMTRNSIDLTTIHKYLR